jgi:hypothetical protein
MLGTTPRLNGRVVIRFAITLEGKVAMAADDGSPPAMGRVANCVREVFGTMLFSRRFRGKEIVVVYPIVFPPAK